MSAAIRRSKGEDLLLRLKGLAHVRALLETRGASPAELSAHGDEIARVRAELARGAAIERRPSADTRQTDDTPRIVAGSTTLG